MRVEERALRTEHQESGLASELDSALRALADPSPPAQWRPRGADPQPVRTVDRLGALVDRLRPAGSWAMLSRVRGATWTQCMRVRGGWIVEVNGEPGPEEFARRIAPTGAKDTGRPHAIRDHGQLMALYRASDAISSPDEVAHLMWAWLRGRIPTGYDLREI